LVDVSYMLAIARFASRCPSPRTASGCWNHRFSLF